MQTIAIKDGRKGGVLFTDALFHLRVRQLPREERRRVDDFFRHNRGWARTPCERAMGDSETRAFLNYVGSETVPEKMRGIDEFRRHFLETGEVLRDHRNLARAYSREERKLVRDPINALNGELVAGGFAVGMDSRMELAIRESAYLDAHHLSQPVLHTLLWVPVIGMIPWFAVTLHELGTSTPLFSTLKFFVTLGISFSASLVPCVLEVLRLRAERKFNAVNTGLQLNPDLNGGVTC